jgi:hypothetical protein
MTCIAETITKGFEKKKKHKLPEDPFGSVMGCVCVIVQTKFPPWQKFVTGAAIACLRVLRPHENESVTTHTTKRNMK